MECWLLELADRILANSQFIKRELVEAYKVPEEKIEVVYAGVNPESFETDANVGLFRSLFCRPEERLVAFVGRLARVKGPHILLEAIPSVLQVCPNARFVFVGDGDMDIVCAGGSALICLLNNGDGSFAPWVALPGAQTECNNVEVTDVNGDGALDAVASIMLERFIMVSTPFAPFACVA